jgi:predicted RNase H-like HicB family nuclease
MTVKAIVQVEERGFWAEVLALPGCLTQGETMDELRTNLQGAIQLWLEAGEPQTTESEEDQILELAIRSRLPGRKSLNSSRKRGLNHGFRG